MSRWKVWAPVLALLLCVVVSVAFGGGVTEEYTNVRKDTASDHNAAPTAHRTAVDGSDSRFWTDTPIDPQEAGTDPTIVVAPRWVDPAATAWVAVGLYHKTDAGVYTWSGIAYVQTLTASSDARASASDKYGVLNGSVMQVDTVGYGWYDVRYFDVSGANTLDSYAHTVGKRSQAAQ